MQNDYVARRLRSDMSAYFSSEGGRTPYGPYTLRKLKNFNFKENRKKTKLKEAGDPLPQFSTFISTLKYEELSISTAVAVKLEISSQPGSALIGYFDVFVSRESQCWKQN